MKSVFHKGFSIAMAFLLLASTASWTVGKHYCMGRLMNVSFFEHAEDCGMNMGDTSDTLLSDDMKSCCSDELIVVEGQDDLKHSLEDNTVGENQFLVAFTTSYLVLFERMPEQLVPYEHYPPPLLVKDIQLLDEVFLI